MIKDSLLRESAKHGFVIKDFTDIKYKIGKFTMNHHR